MDENEDKNASRKAALVFHDVVMREVAEENGRLKVDNAPLKAFRENLQMVKIRYRDGTDDSEVLIVVKLDQGMEEEDGAVWTVVLINRAVSIPVVGSLFKLNVSLSDVNIGTPVHAIFTGQQPRIEMDSHDGTLRLEIPYSNEVSIAGQIENINADPAHVADMIKRNEFQARLSTLLLFGEEEGHPIFQNATYTPKAVKFKVTSSFQRTLDIARVQEPVGPNPDQDEPSNQLRQIVTTVFGDSASRKLVENNLRLKAEHKSLQAARDLLLAVEMFHDAGSVHLKLDQGSLGTDATKSPYWEINMVDMNVSIPVNNLCRVRFLLSGVLTGNPNGPAYVAQPRLVLNEDAGVIFMILSYSSIVTLVGRFDFGNLFNDVEPTEVFRDFHGRIMQSMMGIPALPGVNFQLCGIQLKLGGIQHFLQNVLGIQAPEPAVGPGPVES
jgi:hypothetical protein